MADQSLTGKSVLFLLVDGFESFNFNKLSNCLQQQGAHVIVASFNRDDVITSEDQDTNVKSDISFAQAALEYYDAVIVSDNTTADAIRENVPAMKLIEAVWARGKLVATIDEGAIDLIGAGIVDNKIIAGPPNLYRDLSNAGAKISYTPIAMSDNIFSARADADLNIFCNDIANFLAQGRAAAA